MWSVVVILDKCPPLLLAVDCINTRWREAANIAFSINNYLSSNKLGNCSILC